ncbi:MAG: lamin tail domain-containing protein [Ferruginibacter sp.]
MSKKILFSIGFISIYFITNSQIANRFDIVINELMVDPSPQVSLPNNEWIELKNTSSSAFNLSGFRIGDVTGQSGPMPNYILFPDSVVIVCSASAVGAMSIYGQVISVTNFPSLDNIGDLIFLRSPQNNIIHAINYNDAWYRNELKKEGGWTLEMIDSKNPCSGASNWTSSIDARGGTPGRKNSAVATNPDIDAPQLLRAYATDSLNIILVFNEPLDSSNAISGSSYTISDGIGMPQSVKVLSPVFDKVNLKLNTEIVKNKIYHITVAGVTDCAGNTVGSKNSVSVGLSEVADSMDIVINEILFNPLPNSTDYVEMYNRSKKNIDLKQLYIANRNSTGVISNIKQLSTENYLFFPQNFMVITEDAGLVKRDFITKNMDAFVTIASMPSYNDDKGDVIILNAQGKIIDELQYDEKWHFKLIDNREGVALERIDYNAATQQQDNWHSAATSVGYGTPTYKNSQYKVNDLPKGNISITPEIVSPDNDGMDDFATINYSFPSPGYIANITIFDAAGRPLRFLQRNALCGTSGNYRWDGLGEKNEILPVGIYIIYTEVFNLEGKKNAFKNTIVLARRH